MEEFTKASLLMIKSRVLDVFLGRMEGNTKEIGRLESNTEEVNISYQMGNLRLDSGIKVKRFVGSRKKKILRFIDIS